MTGQDSSVKKITHDESAKYAAEFVGTFFLVLTVGCNVLTGSVGAALSIGGILMAMIYAVGPVSGAHLNPAVTVAVLISTNNRKIGLHSSTPISFATAVGYVVMQLLGGHSGRLELCDHLWSLVHTCTRGQVPLAAGVPR